MKKLFFATIIVVWILCLSYIYMTILTMNMIASPEKFVKVDIGEISEKIVENSSWVLRSIDNATGTLTLQLNFFLPELAVKPLLINKEVYVTYRLLYLKIGEKTFVPLSYDPYRRVLYVAEGYPEKEGVEIGFGRVEMKVVVIHRGFEGFEEITCVLRLGKLGKLFSVTIRRAG